MAKGMTIALYKRKNCGLEYMRDTYNLEQLGGCLPAVGDLIIDRGVPSGLDRSLPENRKVMKVVDRYFLPAAPSRPAQVRLVVEERPGTEYEADILPG